MPPQGISGAIWCDRSSRSAAAEMGLRRQLSGTSAQGLHSTLMATVVTLDGFSFRRAWELSSLPPNHFPRHAHQGTGTFHQPASSR